MVIVSAPGKVILFGEHAVVYGEPSLAGAIDKRTSVTIEKRDDSNISINSNMAPYYRSFSIDDLASIEWFPYVRKAVEISFEHIGEESGLDIVITSEIPIASGLGSSASVSIATILAIHEAFDREILRNELAKLGHKVEQEVQGAASPTDTAIATFGGILFIEPKYEKYQQINASLPLVVGYTGLERSTKTLVENVRISKEKFPEIITSIISNIGKITREAKNRIEKGGDIGELMRINHGLLVALGVSNLKLDRLVYVACDAGASGAKLTGAGGGGCIIAYAPNSQMAVAKAIDKYGCQSFESLITKDGAKVE